jgi:hypothetical protein
MAHGLRAAVRLQQDESEPHVCLRVGRIRGDDAPEHGLELAAAKFT